MNRRAEIIADKPMLPTGGRCIRHVLCAMCLLVFAGALSGWYADEQPACEIRLEIYRRRTGGRDRLLHFQSEAEGAGSHARVFGRTCLGGYEVPGSGEDVREMGERAGRRAFGDAAVHAV